MVRDTERPYFGEDSNNSKNAQFLLGSPVSFCTTVLSAGSGLCPDCAWPGESCSPPHCPWPAPWHQFPLQQQQGVNVCVCIQRKGLPWPLLRFLHFLFPTHTSTGVTTLPWTSPPGTSLSARSTTGTAQENTFKVGTFLKWAHFIFGLF